MLPGNGGPVMPWCMPGNSGPVIPWCMPGNTQPGNARKCTGNSPEIDPLRPRSSGQAGDHGNDPEMVIISGLFRSFPDDFFPGALPAISGHVCTVSGHCRFSGNRIADIFRPFPVIAGVCFRLFPEISSTVCSALIEASAASGRNSSTADPSAVSVCHCVSKNS